VTQGDRTPEYHEGGSEPLDTRLLMPLAGYEPSEFDAIKAKLAAEIAPQAEAGKARWCTERVEQLVSRGIEQWAEGKLGPDVLLQFAAPELGTVAISDVLADPKRFVGRKMADPLDAPDYDPDCAMLLRNKRGRLYINSFAHGGRQYEIVADESAATEIVTFETVMKMIAALPRPGEPGDLSEETREVLRMVAAGDFGPAEVDPPLPDSETLGNDRAVVEARKSKRLVHAGTQGREIRSKNVGKATRSERIWAATRLVPG